MWSKPKQESHDEYARLLTRFEDTVKTPSDWDRLFDPITRLFVEKEFKELVTDKEYNFWFRVTFALAIIGGAFAVFGVADGLKRLGWMSGIGAWLGAIAMVFLVMELLPDIWGVWIAKKKKGMVDTIPEKMFLYAIATTSVLGFMSVTAFTTMYYGVKMDPKMQGILLNEERFERSKDVYFQQQDALRSQIAQEKDPKKRKEHSQKSAQLRQEMERLAQDTKDEKSSLNIVAYTRARRFQEEIRKIPFGPLLLSAFGLSLLINLPNMLTSIYLGFLRGERETERKQAAHMMVTAMTEIRHRQLSSPTVPPQLRGGKSASPQKARDEDALPNDGCWEYVEPDQRNKGHVWVRHPSLDDEYLFGPEDIKRYKVKF